MKLSKEDADLFYELMWALQHFVNQKLKVNPKIETLDDYIKIQAEEKSKVRKAMYEHIEFIDHFIKENPQRFSEDKLQIIERWKSFVQDEFYIERILKKYAILISSKNKVYGVLGIYDSFEDMFFNRPLPFCVKAVLLPFKGSIIYDGLFEGYNIFFGRGISGDLKETYMKVRQKGQIIETLEPKEKRAIVQRSDKPTKDWKPELDELLEKTKVLKGGTDQPIINSPAFNLIKASLELGKLAVSNPDDLNSLWKGVKKVERSLKNIENVLIRSER